VFDLDTYAAGLAAALGMAVGAWVVSIPLRNVSIVDSLWSLFFLLMTLVYVLFAPAAGTRALLTLFLVGVWSVRLSVYVTQRNWGEPEDRRYRAIREGNEPGFWYKSLYIVFGLQAILAWIISLPLLTAVVTPTPIGWLDYAAVGLWLVGLGFEAVADAQLAAFKARPENQGRVLVWGLWRFSRHPNYFGEACVWWGLWLLGAASGAWWTIISPLLMTFLLLRVSGVALLERDIVDRRPGYRAYIDRTNAFVPGPPRA
jgi:steroid 5-alpha reductase family enzyme